MICMNLTYKDVNELVKHLWHFLLKPMRNRILCRSHTNWTTTTNLMAEEFL